jgi:hypothetical protein
MTEPWIRVHANLVDKPIIDRAVDALDVSEHEAIGLMVTFWGSVSQNVIGGHLSDVSDRQIERWARWHGRRGRFANFIRTAHLDDDGRVNEWDEYAGALESRRAKERERLRNKRHPVAQHVRNNRGDVAQRTHQTVNGVAPLLQPARAVRNETIRNEEPAVAVAAIDFARALAIAANRGLAEHATRPQPIPRVMPDAGRSLQAAEDLIAGGVSIEFATAEVYRLANEHDADGLITSLKYFVAPTLRAWQRRAAKSDSDDWIPPSRGVNGQPATGSPRAPRRDFGGARNDAAIDAWLADKERQRADAEDVTDVEPEPEEITHGE